MREMTRAGTVKGALIGMLGVIEERKGQKEMTPMASLLDQDMHGLLLHQNITIGAGIDRSHLGQLQMPEHMTRCQMQEDLNSRMMKLTQWQRWRLLRRLWKKSRRKNLHLSYLESLLLKRTK